MLRYFCYLMALLLLQLSGGAEAFIAPSRRGICIHLKEPGTHAATPTDSAVQILFAASNGSDDRKGGNKDFWTQQKELAEEMSTQTTKSLRQEQAEKFELRRLALVYDTAYFAFFLFCGCWMLFENPFTAFSYAFGATMGLAYSYGLGKSVETIGQSIDDVVEQKGAGVGEARFAFLILLFVLVGKFRGETGLQEIPSIAGFFTYQLASLNQGLREIND